MQTVSTAFHNAALSNVVPIVCKAYLSFNKEYNDATQFLTFDSSEFDGLDLFAPSDDNPISYWDYYRYLDYTARLVKAEWTREMDLIYSVSSAMADITLNNFDDYFTPNSGSPIDQYIKPKRPIRLYAGYKNAQVVQQFVGLTEKYPVRDEDDRTVSIHATDFLTEIFALDLKETIAMAGITTDVFLAAVFTQFGLAPSSYQLAVGRNTIPFLFFEKGNNVGETIREVMQAEGGRLWIDEQGVIRFESRLTLPQTPVISLDDSSVASIKSLGDDYRINYVKILTKIREVQPYQVVFSNAREPGTDFVSSGDPFIIAANSTRDYPATLSDPCLTVTEPTYGENSGVSWVTAVDAAGVEVTSDVTIDGSTLNTNEFIITITNDNAFPIEIDQVELWGEPARVIDTLDYKAKDQDSIDAGDGEMVLDIQNDYFGSYNNCDSFAETIIDSYSQADPIIEATIKGDFSLQMGDVAYINTRLYDGNYRILSITNVIKPYEYKIRAIRYTPRSWFTFDVSEFDGDDVLAP